jgi:spore photoproduct lyase
VAVVNTNLEEFVERQVRPAAEQEPWQKVFMYNSALSDTPCFEPEYGLTELLARFYATTPDQHCLIHTKSGNVEFIRSIEHRERVIMLWSLTGDTAARLIEPGSASPTERIEAARICQDAGCPVRFKLKPIVPVRGWREEYSEVISQLFSRTSPESIGLFMLAWMDFEEMRECIDLNLLDPQFAQALEESADDMRGVTAGPFPHAARADVYRTLYDEIRKHDKSVPVFLCTETVEMWQEFAPVLGMEPGNYICACGPQSLPGLRRVAQVLEPSEMRS